MAKRKIRENASARARRVRRSARAERIRRASRAASARYYRKLDIYNGKANPTANDIASLRREWVKTQRLRALEKSTWSGGANAPLMEKS
jgi:hypothetical protein